MKLTMGQAAKHLGCSKATLSRAIKEGRLSAHRKEDNSFAIDPAELQRYADEAGMTFSAEPLQETNEKQSTTPDATPETPVETGASTAILETQLEGLKALLAEKERRITDLEEDRRELKEERERLLKLVEDAALTVKAITMQGQGAKPAEAAPPPPPAQAAPQAPRSLLDRLLGRGRSNPSQAA